MGRASLAEGFASWSSKGRYLPLRRFPYPRKGHSRAHLTKGVVRPNTMQGTPEGLAMTIQTSYSVSNARLAPGTEEKT